MQAVCARHAKAQFPAELLDIDIRLTVQCIEVSLLQFLPGYRRTVWQFYCRAIRHVGDDKDFQLGTDRLVAVL